MNHPCRQTIASCPGQRTRLRIRKRVRMNGRIVFVRERSRGQKYRFLKRTGTWTDRCFSMRQIRHWMRNRTTEEKRCLMDPRFVGQPSIQYVTSPPEEPEEPEPEAFVIPENIFGSFRPLPDRQDYRTVPKQVSQLYNYVKQCKPYQKIRYIRYQPKDFKVVRIANISQIVQTMNPNRFALLCSLLNFPQHKRYRYLKRDFLRDTRDKYTVIFRFEIQSSRNHLPIQKIMKIAYTRNPLQDVEINVNINRALGLSLSPGITKAGNKILRSSHDNRMYHVLLQDYIPQRLVAPIAQRHQQQIVDGLLRLACKLEYQCLDIRPKNFRVDNQGQLRFIDFDEHCMSLSKRLKDMGIMDRDEHVLTASRRKHFQAREIIASLMTMMAGLFSRTSNPFANDSTFGHIRRYILSKPDESKFLMELGDHIKGAATRFYYLVLYPLNMRSVRKFYRFIYSARLNANQNQVRARKAVVIMMKLNVERQFYQLTHVDRRRELKRRLAKTT